MLYRFRIRIKKKFDAFSNISFDYITFLQFYLFLQNFLSSTLADILCLALTKY